MRVPAKYLPGTVQVQYRVKSNLESTHRVTKYLLKYTQQSSKVAKYLLCNEAVSSLQQKVSTLPPDAQTSACHVRDRLLGKLLVRFPNPLLKEAISARYTPTQLIYCSSVSLLIE